MRRVGALFQQATPVDQPDEVVLPGLADELVLGSLALGHVLTGSEDGDDPAARIVQADRRDGDVHQVPVTVTAPGLDLEHVVASRGSPAQPLALPAVHHRSWEEGHVVSSPVSGLL
jgi:hypothetical protein